MDIALCSHRKNYERFGENYCPPFVIEAEDGRFQWIVGSFYHFETAFYPKYFSE
jgi:hypothetical protein